jgi:hypothetical protein
MNVTSTSPSLISILVRRKIRNNVPAIPTTDGTATFEKFGGSQYFFAGENTNIPSESTPEIVPGIYKVPKDGRLETLARLLGKDVNKLFWKSQAPCRAFLDTYSRWLYIREFTLLFPFEVSGRQLLTSVHASDDYELGSRWMLMLHQNPFEKQYTTRWTHCFIVPEN